jgi:2-hydroxy-palmitic acid dioxygenase Mpo1-like
MTSRRPRGEARLGFLEELSLQRWDDHRLYHHSRINQSLHLVSALSFLCAYLLLAVNPGVAAVIGWLVAMWSRQIGHFFFEPKGYDVVNELSHARKEEIKVGYNLKRKIVLLAAWALTPFMLLVDPTMLGWFEPPANAAEFVDHLAVLWLVLGAIGLLFRTVQLFFVRNVQTGLVWCTKILTDPFHDLMLYHRSPLFLMRGQLIDPMLHVHDGEPSEEAGEAVG